MSKLTAQPLVQNRSIALNPAPDRDVVHRKPAFRHHFFQIAVAKGIAQIPTNAQNDEDILEVPSPEQPRSIVGHCLNLSKSPDGFATDPISLKNSLRVNGCVPSSGLYAILDLFFIGRNPDDEKHKLF